MIIIKIIGGLGNQLFQYASGRALSIHLNCELKFDLSYYEDQRYNKIFRLDKFNIPIICATKAEIHLLKNRDNIPISIIRLKKLGISLKKYFKKTHLIEDQILQIFNTANNSLKDFYVEGWLANPNYFNAYRETIVEDLNADNNISCHNRALITELKSIDSVAIHIRRKDYLTNNFFVNLPLEYYKTSIEYIKHLKNNPKFYFFSDDIAWVKENFSYINNAIFTEDNSEYETEWTSKGDITDLMLMKSCKHQIIANSTYSWWAAWLNENPEKIVCYPEHWYQNKQAQEKFYKKSHIPKEWTCIYFPLPNE